MGLREMTQIGDYGPELGSGCLSERFVAPNKPHATKPLFFEYIRLQLAVLGSKSALRLTIPNRS